MLLVSLRGKIVKNKFKFHTLANTGNARIVFFFFFFGIEQVIDSHMGFLVWVETSYKHV